MPQAFSSVTSLAGGLRVNYAIGLAAYEDPGGKIAQCISALNQLFQQVSYIQTLISASRGSGVTFSGLSTTAFSATMGNLTNFIST